ncbi:MAG: tyrosine-type recombinase/integrase [Desulfuromonadaceae bacterium]|nr:tyrosine-type recombinase/integrase [Desulfuromonadaceae bacterium]
MPKVKLTKTKIDSLKFSSTGREVYWDTDTKGLGLAVGMKTKTFILQMDVKDSSKKSGYRTVKKTLGRFGDDITLEQARDMIRGHIDKETGEAVLGERIKIKLGDVSSVGDDVTLQALVTSYFKETKRRDGKDRKADSAAYYKNLIERHYAGWLDMTLKEVNDLTPDVIMEKFQQLATGGPLTARNGVVMLSAVLNYGMAKYPGTLKSNPMAILTSRHVNVMPKIEPRHDSLIFDAEKRRNDYQAFYQGLQSEPEVRRDLFLFTLFTGMRKQESATLQWLHVDLEHKELHVKDTKNRADLHIPLNRQAMAILHRRKEHSADGVAWVFPALITRKPDVEGHTNMMASHLRKITGLKITIHGLRRTFITVGRKLKRYEDTDRLTNHVDSSMAGKHYDETDIEDLRETCQMIGNEIERRMLAETAKVIQIGSAKAA